MAEVVRIVEPVETAPQSLPQNVEAEAALLGALMIDNRLVEDVQLKLRPDHFYEPLHGRIYEAILRMTDANRIANPVTLRPLFDSDESIKEVGGPAYLAQLTGSGAAVIGARDFAQQIYDLALLRELVAEPIICDDGIISAPTRAGLGVTPRPEFVKEFRVMFDA